MHVLIYRVTTKNNKRMWSTMLIDNSIRQQKCMINHKKAKRYSRNKEEV